MRLRASRGSSAQDSSAQRAYSVAAYAREGFDTLLPEWRGLHDEVGSWSPFSDPDFAVVWCRTFVPEGQERVVAVRRERDGRLVGVVPLFFASSLLARKVVRALYPFGALVN